MRKLEVKNPGIQDDEPGTKKTCASNNKTVYTYNQNATTTNSSLFDFDPNTISHDEWKQFGMREKTITTIENYLSKGGVFKKPGDLQKVYGLHQNEYDRIAPYVQIETVTKNHFTDEPVSEKSNFKKNIEPSFSHVIDKNTADTTAFIALPGRGSKLALRIISFRDKLGGFYSIDQAKETYGVADSVFQKIKPHLKCDVNSIKKKM